MEKLRKARLKLGILEAAKVGQTVYPDGNGKAINGSIGRQFIAER
jgi:hypothetical protein